MEDVAWLRNKWGIGAGGGIGSRTEEYGLFVRFFLYKIATSFSL
jgi:hypothetical protein